MNIKKESSSLSAIPAGIVFNEPIRVLIADDDITSINFFKKPLEEAGYNVVIANDGNEAKKIILSKSPPDIALLDWMMPGLTGPELCTIIKEEVDSFIYTVLVTARTELKDVITGLESGAHEFLAKPVNLVEFILRMAAAVRILQYEKDLSKKTKEIHEYASQMEKLAETRARQLVHAERLATLGMLSAGIGHEIRNPLAYVSGNIQIFQRYYDDIRAALEHALKVQVGDPVRISFILENGQRMWSSIVEGTKTVTSLLDSLSKFAHRGTSKRTQVYLERCIKDAMEISKNSWKYHVEFKLNIQSLPPIMLNCQEITQVLVNLFINASYAMKDRNDESNSILKVSLSQNNNYHRIVVTDNGPGIPEDIMEQIWDPFFTTKDQGEGTGLGLAICSGIIEEHYGTIICQNSPEGGASFIIDLPQSEQSF